MNSALPKHGQDDSLNVLAVAASWRQPECTNQVLSTDSGYVTPAGEFQPQQLTESRSKNLNASGEVCPRRLEQGESGASRTDSIHDRDSSAYSSLPPVLQHHMFTLEQVEQRLRQKHGAVSSNPLSCIGTPQSIENPSDSVSTLGEGDPRPSELGQGNVQSNHGALHYHPYSRTPHSPHNPSPPNTLNGYVLPSDPVQVSLPLVNGIFDSTRSRRFSPPQAGYLVTSESTHNSDPRENESLLVSNLGCSDGFEGLTEVPVMDNAMARYYAGTHFEANAKAALRDVEAQHRIQSISVVRPPITDPPSSEPVSSLSMRFRDVPIARDDQSVRRSSMCFANYDETKTRWYWYCSNCRKVYATKVSAEMHYRREHLYPSSSRGNGRTSSS